MTARYPSDLACDLAIVPELGLLCGQSAAFVIEPDWKGDPAPPGSLARCMDHYRATISATADLALTFVVRQPYDLQAQEATK